LREAGRWSWRHCSRDVVVLTCVPSMLFPQANRTF